MNKVKLCLLGLVAFFLANPYSYAQVRNCGSMEYLNYQMSTDAKRASKLEKIERHYEKVLESSFRAVEGVITIPIVVHVVYNTSAENISDAQIQSQITVLNDDFRRMNSDADGTWSQAADSQIEFCLATVDPSGNPTTGITRTSTSTTAFGTNDQMKFNSSGGKDAWPASDYLNFWVCDISGGILGYAQFPGGSASTDGVVNDYQYTGTIGTASAPFDLGRTATHEVGHWLNLRHIWGDGGCSVDDYVSDTPTSDGANYGCATGHSSCSSTDMVQNYMDYSDDACMNLFTAGQKDRMRAIFEPGGYRVSLLTSNGCGEGTAPTCTDGIQNGSETDVDCGGPDCDPCAPCTDNIVTISITFDNYPEETSWTLTSGGSTIASGGTYGSQPDGSTYSEDLCLPDGCYDFTINDGYGDGICCSYGSGSYSVTSASGTLASGGSFADSETTNFCFGGGPAPTCTDGIQNGSETDVDCGGPDCDPCATCTDGIQNGDETDVDCGGPDCDPCATCTDGIQNGDETDVDCGGPDCEACATCTDGIMNGDETDIDCGGPDCEPCGGGGDCTYELVNSEGFESGFGIWNDGGSDCARSSNNANSGAYSVYLRDNSSTSVMTTDNLNLSSYDKINVDFSYYAVSMDNSNEDFFLEVSTNGGSSFAVVEEWNRDDEFLNNQRKYDAVEINGPFTTNTQLRFRCDASGNSDWVYLDDISIFGCSSEGGPTPTCTDGVQNGLETDVDCGGSDCPACPTCTDGIQNGNETDVDCGGSDCPACPTCFDGIQNGSETGTDCGGPDCEACDTGGGCSYVLIDSHGFEGNWGIWNDGGSDCAISTSNTNSGTYCVRLRDNTSTSVTTTDVLNLSAYDELTVDFSYYAVSMDNANEDFWLQVSTDGGSSYTIVEEWNQGDEFLNNQRKYDAVVIPGPFSSTTTLRFRADGSGNNDWVYIDDITITGCLNSSKELENVIEEELISSLRITDLSLFPNPARDVLNVSFNMYEAQSLTMSIMDISGKVVETVKVSEKAGAHQLSIETGDLVPGMYFLNMMNENGSMTRKFIIQR